MRYMLIFLLKVPSFLLFHCYQRANTVKSNTPHVKTSPRVIKNWQFDLCFNFLIKFTCPWKNQDSVLLVIYTLVKRICLDRCIDGYYGNPSSGQSCRPCLCPDVPSSNRYFAHSCYQNLWNSDVICNCLQGYAGMQYTS